MILVNKQTRGPQCPTLMQVANESLSSADKLHINETSLIVIWFCHLLHEYNRFS